LDAEWRTVDDPSLADRIRDDGLQVDVDSRLEGVTDRKYVREAMVIGVPVDDVEGETLHVALVTPDSESPDADTVHYITVPRGEMPETHSLSNPEGSGTIQIYPFRVGSVGEPFDVAILSGDVAGGDWRVEPTYLKNPTSPTINGTHGYAPLV
jgi:hypothetical protein